MAEYTKDQVVHLCVQHIAKASQELRTARDSFNAAVASYAAESKKVCKRLEKDNIPLADFIAECNKLDAQPDKT